MTITPQDGMFNPTLDNKLGVRPVACFALCAP